jgi:anti-sigma regulatory factor (Ser/Thr protein kinase)
MARPASGQMVATPCPGIPDQRAAGLASMTMTLPRSARVGQAAREAVRAFVHELGEQSTADACLLVSELVTNAYRHGRGDIRLRITVDHEVARFAVYDGGQARFLPIAHPDEHGGWGLNLVQRIADRWGIGATPTHVWFELQAPRRSRQPRGSLPPLMTA